MWNFLPPKLKLLCHEPITVVPPTGGRTHNTLGVCGGHWAELIISYSLFLRLLMVPGSATGKESEYFSTCQVGDSYYSATLTVRAQAGSKTSK